VMWDSGPGSVSLRRSRSVPGTSTWTDTGDVSKRIGQAGANQDLPESSPACMR
jgi:hypothetical protein